MIMEKNNGVCSTDQVITELRNKIKDAENAIECIISEIPHCEVTGMVVIYNASSSSYKISKHVNLQYRIY
jgi:hypothetical protein